MVGRPLPVMAGDDTPKPAAVQEAPAPTPEVAAPAISAAGTVVVAANGSGALSQPGTAQPWFSAQHSWWWVMPQSPQEAAGSPTPIGVWQ